jgi:adenosylcobinamide-phosphate synthase
MAAGAGALEVQLGGPAAYHGEMQDRPVLGEGKPAQAETINQACQLIKRGLTLWVAIIAVGVIW